MPGEHPIQIVTDDAGDFRPRCLNPACAWQGIAHPTHAGAADQGAAHVAAAAAGEL
jgi:hypothetical protein